MFQNNFGYFPSKKMNKFRNIIRKLIGKLK